MLRNYFLVTLRNLLKNRLYAFINIAGLAIGITCSILIILWVSDELSYDTAIPKCNRLQQVYINAKFDGTINSWRSVPLPTYEAMKTADANIAQACVTGWGGDRLITFEDTRLVKRSYFVSEEFLEMFEFKMVNGNAADVLDDPSSIVITESTAKALFGDEDPMNKIVKVDDKSLLKVTGILKDIPKNSSFQFDFLMTWKHRESISEWVVRNTTNWGNYSFQVFIELNDELKHDETELNIKNMLIENSKEHETKDVLFLHPLLEWRLRSNFENGVATGGLNDYVQLFTIIAIFILIIACINFMNLATARSERRAKEVGIRKSIGSNRIELIMQFLGESLLIAFVSFVFAIMLTQLMLPFYNGLVDKQLFIDYSSLNFWLFAFGIIAFTGLVSGSYPAFYLSSFKPVKTLKGSISVGKSASTPRKVLVIMQFGFAIFLMVGTVIIFKQIELVKSRELGYQQEKLITIYTTDELEKNYSVLKQDLLQSGAVEAVTKSNSAITSINSNNFLGWPGKPEELKVIFTTITTEYDYAKTMGIKILQGRDFSEDFKSDSTAIIINQAGLDLMNLEDPIGTELDLWGDKRTLIGVVDNVLMGSPYTEVKPMFLIMDDWGGTMTVRLSENKDITETMPTVKALFEKHNPAYPFDYTFADQDFQKKFKTINMTSNLATLFAFLAILITGLGLFGLASYTAEQRTKEIGIRKVLGASVMSLIGLMSKEFSRLVIVAFVISAPIAWWLLDKYLERYQIRTEISWWIFPVTGLIALIYAIIIVTNQARRAATANPVNSLRNE